MGGLQSFLDFGEEVLEELLVAGFVELLLQSGGEELGSEGVPLLFRDCAAVVLVDVLLEVGLDVLDEGLSSCVGEGLCHQFTQFGVVVEELVQSGFHGISHFDSLVWSFGIDKNWMILTQRERK